MKLHLYNKTCANHARNCQQRKKILNGKQVTGFGTKFHNTYIYIEGFFEVNGTVFEAHALQHGFQIGSVPTNGAQAEVVVFQTRTTAARELTYRYK